MPCNCSTCEAVRNVIQIAVSGPPEDGEPYDFKTNLGFAFSVLLDAMAVIACTTWSSADSKELAADCGGLTERYLAERIGELRQMRLTDTVRRRVLNDPALRCNRSHSRGA
jgi:hypothetical protein